VTLGSAQAQEYSGRAPGTRSDLGLAGPPESDLASRTVLAAIGRTPLFDFCRLARAAGVPAGTRILAKAEYLNPGGSGKDRLALELIRTAEQRGLKPGGVVVEASSGNTGISVAMVAAVRGYRAHVVVSSKVADEKIRILRALGAVVHVVPSVPHGDPDNYLERARKLAAELPGSHYLDQFRAQANTLIHERETGPELYEQAFGEAGRLDAFVCGAGTGGTLTGIARYLRRASPQTRIVLADPAGSVLSGNPVFRPYLLEGIGDDAHPPLYDARLTDESVTIADEESFRFALLAARLEGTLVGGSSGCHLAAAAKVGQRLPPGAVVATILPDTGRNYLSKFYDPSWCDKNGLPGLHTEVAA
jgi:cystathionine beta-synthase